MWDIIFSLPVTNSVIGKYRICSSIPEISSDSPYACSLAAIYDYIPLQIVVLMYYTLQHLYDECRWL